jgi:peptidoglycan hydrolase-like protein with peptidoglycan-binding domain
MNQLAKPSLSVKWWDSVRPKSGRGRDLENALGDYEKVSKRASDDDPQVLDDVSSSLKDVIDAATRAIRECDRTADREVVTKLQTLAGLAKRERELCDAKSKALAKVAQRNKNEDVDDEDDAEAPLLATKRLKALLKVAQKNPLPFACGYEGKETFFVLDRTRRGASLKSALEKAASCRGSTFGTARVEDGVLLLTVDGPPLTGLRKRVSDFLRGNQPLPVRKARIAGEADVEENENDEAAQPLGKGDASDGDAPAPTMTSSTAGSLKIRSSVGRGGANKTDDVTAVQNALNAHGAKLTVDGRMGPATLKAISDFQRKVGFRNPDGRIDPGQVTEVALRTGKLSADDLAVEKEKKLKPVDAQPAVDRQQRTEKLKDTDAATKEHIKKVLAAVDKERKRIESEVSGAFVALREFEPTAAGHPIEADLERLRTRLQREVDLGKERVTELMRAADELIVNPSTLARRELDDAARAASQNFKEQSTAAEAAQTFVLMYSLE